MKATQNNSTNCQFAGTNYQVYTMKTFNKRNEMHKYGVVYLNRGNDLYVAKDVPRLLPISSPTSLLKS